MRMREEKPIKTVYLKTTGVSNFSLSTIDTITSLTIPLNEKKRIKDILENPKILTRRPDETDEELIERILESTKNS
jgi:hypothetical protein